MRAGPRRGRRLRRRVFLRLRVPAGCGTTALAPRSAIASWHSRVSQAPSAVAESLPSLIGIRLGRPGRTFAGSLGPIAFARSPSPMGFPRDCADLRRVCVDPAAEPGSDPPPGAAMLAGVPLGFAFDREPLPSIRRYSGPCSRAFSTSIFRRRDSVLKTHRPPSPARRSTLSTNSVVCRDAIPNRAFREKQGLEGGVTVVCCRPHLPVGIEPDRQRAPALERFVGGRQVPCVVGPGSGLIIRSNENAGFSEGNLHGIRAAGPG